MSRSILVFGVLSAMACECGQDADTAEEYEWQECKSAMPILGLFGEQTGFVRCLDGSINRSEVVAVDLEQYDSLMETPSWCGGTIYRDCVDNDDCDTESGERCLESQFGYCSCVAGCSTDDDCLHGGVCVHPSARGEWYGMPLCVYSNECQSDQDCASGECGLTAREDDNFYYYGLYCRTAEDECRTDEDCGWDCFEGRC